MMGYVEITTRVVPASRAALVLFPLKDLRDYAKTLGVKPQPSRSALITAMLATKHATLCASLGN